MLEVILNFTCDVEAFNRVKEHNWLIEGVANVNLKRFTFLRHPVQSIVSLIPSIIPKL